MLIVKLFERGYHWSDTKAEHVILPDVTMVDFRMGSADEISCAFLTINGEEICRPLDGWAAVMSEAGALISTHYPRKPLRLISEKAAKEVDQ